VLTGLWFHKAGRVYYKYNVGYVLRGRWPYWLFPIATLHGTRLVRRNVQKIKIPAIKYTAERGDGPATPRGHGADSGVTLSVTLSRLRA
jgi:hypothetical protein